jgi:hypothetical protein
VLEAEDNERGVAIDVQQALNVLLDLIVGPMVVEAMEDRILNVDTMVMYRSIEWGDYGMERRGGEEHPMAGIDGGSDVDGYSGTIFERLNSKKKLLLEKLMKIQSIFNSKMTNKNC